MATWANEVLFLHKWLILLVASSIISSCMSCKSVNNEEQSFLLDVDPIDKGELRIFERWTLSTEELSGLTFGSFSGLKNVLVGIVDEKFEIAILDTKNKGSMPSIAKISSRSNNLRKKSKWEAVVFSGPQTLVALEEYPPTLEFINTNFMDITDAISIDVEKLLPNQDENSFAEGIVLLNDGHALIAIEKNPLAIVEVGPKEDAPIGYKSDLVFNPSDTWKPNQQKLYGLKKWKISNLSEKHLSDLSDIAVDETGQLFLLSDQSRIIARVEGALGPDEHKFNIREFWKLPAEIAKPEGFVVYNEMFYVVSDTTKDAPNLFLLKR